MANLNKMGGQFARFFVVGIAATLIHWGTYIVLNRLFGLEEGDKLALTITYSIGYAVSFIGNYILSLKWTFRTSGNVKKGAGIRIQPRSELRYAHRPAQPVPVPGSGLADGALHACGGTVAGGGAARAGARGGYCALCGICGGGSRQLPAGAFLFDPGDEKRLD